MPYKLNIPKNLIEFQDGGLSFRNSTETNTTRSVLVLGLSQDGPVEPVAVSIDTVGSIFGKDVNENGTSNGGTITTAVHDLHRAGCRDIRAMKISGEPAVSSIGNTSNSKTTTHKVEETLGFMKGNAETTFTLANSNILENSVRVYVDDKLLSTNCQFTKGNSQLVIPAGVADAGSPVTVRYSYNKAIVSTSIETLSVEKGESDSLFITLSNKPKNDQVTITYGDVLVENTKYTVSSSEKKVTFNKEDLRKKAKVASGIEEHSMVVVEYTYDDTTVVDVTETSNSTGQYVTATANQVFNLSQDPKVGSVKVYCDEEEASTLNYSIKGQVLTLKRDKFSRGAVISCSYLVEKVENVKSTIEFESYFTGNVYNGGKIIVSEIKNEDSKVIGKTVTIRKPEDKKVTNEEDLVYSSLVYPTFNELVNAINDDIANGVYKCYTDNGDELVSSLVTGTFYFTGGDSGLNWTKDQLKEALSGKRNSEGLIEKEGVYQLLKGYNVDYVVLTGVYADEEDQLTTKESFDYDLAVFCAAMSHETRITYGAIATTPCKKVTLRGIKEYVDKLSKFNKDGKRFLLKMDGKVYYNSENKPYDLGQYIRVVGGAEPLYLNDDLGKHAANPAIAYIGLQSSLNAQSAPLNKPLPNSKGLRFKIQEPYLEQLTQANIITFTTKYSATGSVKTEAYVFDSMTCALPGSDYVRTTTCEVVKLIGDDTREITDPYRGEPPTIESRNAMAAALSKRFSQRKQEGVVSNTTFDIIETAEMQLNGECLIRLEVIAPGERRSITTTIGLKPNA